MRDAIGCEDMCGDRLCKYIGCKMSNKLYGLPKLHKPNIPMRPIVSFCGSPTYQLSKHLTNILKPLTDKSRHKLQSTDNFIDAIKTVQIPDNHKLVSLDVKSLFTSVEELIYYASCKL